MSNTIIQVKRSATTSQPTNGSLTAAEPAYSYVSDKLFLGDSTGAGVITVGGKFYVDQQNVIFAYANAAYAQANAASGTAAADAAAGAFAKANSAYGHANGSFVHANGAFAAGNTTLTYAQAAFGHANGSYGHANAAFTKANSALTTAGGTITGDLVVQGNATFSGTITYANTQTLLIGDNILTLNADLPGDVAPSENAGIEVDRGSSANVSLLWNEGSDTWTFTNNGTTYAKIASNTDVEAVASTVGAAFAQANSAYGHANGAFSSGNTTLTYAQAAFGHANGAFTAANTSATTASAAFAKANTADTNAANASYLSVGTVPSARISGSYTGITGVGTITTGTWNGTAISVPYGGTGRTTANTNGILFGNGTGALNVTAAGTEGQVLQVSVAGVPQFGSLDGGNF